jgi:hypothetical protein
MNSPEWLTVRNGFIKPGIDPQTWMVTLDGHPQYRLFATPAGGVFTCAIFQSNNGKRLDGGKTYPTVEAALAGGLDELRERLGW